MLCLKMTKLHLTYLSVEVCKIHYFFSMVKKKMQFGYLGRVWYSRLIQIVLKAVAGLQ